MSEVEQFKNSFPDDLQKLLDFYEEGDYIIAKPKRYLPNDDFKAVASIVKELGGEYISAGKESRFRSSKLHSISAPDAQLPLLAKLKKARSWLNDAIEELEK